MTSETDLIDGAERVAKVIARSGLASRREAEKIVADGRVQVNGSVVHHPGHPVKAGVDDIRVDGKPIRGEAPKIWFLLFKPKGYITGRNDPEGRPSVMDLIGNLDSRVEPVGRLDMDTEGALLFTNEGDIAHKLTHPSSQVPKRYLAKVWKTPSDKTMERIQHGIKLDDGFTGPCRARIVDNTDGGNAWMEITVTEGRNRLIRRLFEAVGHPVSKLRRESFATISIRGLERGEMRALTQVEIDRLHEIAEGRDPRDAGHGSHYKAGFAKAKPKYSPLRQRKQAARKAAGDRVATKVGGGGKGGKSGGPRR
jgi:23S rRNA pseudouridine2605 synthase